MKFEYSFKDVANLLAQDAEKVARYLLPNGKRNANEWCVGSVHGETGKSLKVHLSGNKAGVWCDFATGQRGDLLKLWECVRGITSKEAIIEAKEWLGIKDIRSKVINFPKMPAKVFKKPTQNPEDLVNNSECFKYLTKERKLTAEILSMYKIGEAKVKVSNKPMIVFPYRRGNEVIMNKTLFLERDNGKKKIFTTRDAEPCLFGWHMVPADARSVAIFEGEIDAMTAHQYGIERFNAETKMNEPIGMLSVPFGGGVGDKQRWIEYEFDNLSVYDQIFLVMDNDEEGRTATDEIIKRLGRHKCSIVELPHKDINECLQKGILPQTIQECFNNARTADPRELVSASKYEEQVVESFAIDRDPELVNSVKEGVKQGYDLPWEGLKDNVKLRPKSLSVVTGINGHGKSQVLGQIILDCIKQGAKACIASLEMNPIDLLKRLMRQSAGVKLPSDDFVKNIFNWLEGKLFLFDHVGSVDTNQLLEVLTYASRKYGVDIFVIDSLMKCGICSDDYNEQKRFVDSLCAFKDMNDCHVYLVAHPRKSDDEYSPPGKMDISGTADITNLADYCLTVWRNTIKEDKVQAGDLEARQQPDATIKYTKQRGGDGWIGSIPLWFDKDSCQYLQYGVTARSIIDFSAIQYSDLNSFNENEKTDLEYYDI